MQKLHFDGPINSLSLGNVSFNFLRELWRKDVDTVLFPTGNTANFEAFDNADPKLVEWIKQSGFSRLKRIDKDAPTLKNWHINGSENRVAPNQYLYTYYEVDSPTEEEIAIVNSQKHVFFSSSFAAEIFRNRGCNNVSYVPLGFDEDFGITGKRFPEEVIHFGLIGKFERRKNTRQIIQTWLKKYGNNNKYLLTCLVNNPFFKPEDFKQIIADTLGGKTWSNINFLPTLAKNSEVNEVLNAIDIDLSGYSNSEGWGLGSFNATALGKWSIVSNYSAHKDWANEKNSILVEPVGIQPCYDNYFFRPDQPFNQGNYAKLSEESLVSAMEQAEKRAKTINSQGLLLKEKFTYKKSVDQILKQIN
jgi:hypothetical protein